MRDGGQGPEPGPALVFEKQERKTNMTSQCDDQILGHAWLGKDEPISRAQPIKAKRRGWARESGEDFIITSLPPSYLSLK